MNCEAQGEVGMEEHGRKGRRREAYYENVRREDDRYGNQRKSGTRGRDGYRQS